MIVSSSEVEVVDVNRRPLGLLSRDEDGTDILSTTAVEPVVLGA